MQQPLTSMTQPFRPALLTISLLLAACGQTPDSPTAPSVRSVSPQNGSTNVSTSTAVTLDVNLLNNSNGRNGIDPRTLTSSAVRLIDTTSNAYVPAVLNTTAAGDAVTLQPNSALKTNTKYIFEVTGALKDLNGNSFHNFTSTFTTGASSNPTLDLFTKQELTSVPDRPYTNLVVGPDRKLYASTITGEIVRFAINADGTLGPAETLSSLVNQQGPRTVIGMAFDPASTASNLILWVTNNHFYDYTANAPEWSGKITRMSGATLQNVQDVVVGLPRSTRDHLTNNLTFDPNNSQVMYISQGGNNAFGAPDSAWGFRPERKLSAAILKLDQSKLPASLPLNVRTSEEGDTTGTYNPYTTSSPLTVYASGIRNGYSLVWHSNGHLYAPVNGSAAGGSTPERPNTLPANCGQVRPDNRTSLPYAPALSNLNYTEPDFLVSVQQNGYYGHPNPARCEYTLNGGNPTSGTDPMEVYNYSGNAGYPVGTQPDPNYRRPVYVFPNHTSPNGVIEYKCSSSILNRHLLVVRFSAGKDVVGLKTNSDGTISGAMITNIGGLQNFSPSPLSIVQDPQNCNLYVAQLNDTRSAVNGRTQGLISLVKPK